MSSFSLSELIGFSISVVRCRWNLKNSICTTMTSVKKVSNASDQILPSQKLALSSKRQNIKHISVIFFRNLNLLLEILKLIYFFLIFYEFYITELTSCRKFRNWIFAQDFWIDRLYVGLKWEIIFFGKY